MPELVSFVAEDAQRSFVSQFEIPVAHGMTVGELAQLIHNEHLLPGSVSVVTAPAHGHATVNADGTVTYTANSGFGGTDSFTYTVSDDAGATSAPATVTVAGTGVVEPTNPDVADTDGSTPVTIALTMMLYSTCRSESSGR